jgi:hypothetical protein
MRSLLLAVPALVLVSGCAASIGGPGPQGVAGPPGPAGPPGAPNRAPHRLALLRTTANITVPDDIDVVVTDGAGITVTLPTAVVAGQGRTITVRAMAGPARIMATGGDQIDTSAVLGLDKAEMVTVISDGTSRWLIIASSDL